MKKFLSLFILFTFLGLFSCTELILGKDTESTPSSNFNALWNELDMHYGLFVARGWDWDSIRNHYEPIFEDPQITTEDQWKYMTEMLEYLDDSHSIIRRTDIDSTFKSGFALNFKAIEEFDLNLVEELYLDSLQAANPEEQILYSSLASSDVGYIKINSFLNYDPETIDIAVEALRESKAIIVDVRNSNGGSDLTAQRLAGEFADGEHFVYSSQSRNGIEHDSFDEPLLQYTARSGEVQYTEPVILLTDRKTISAAEEFCLHMKAFNHVTQIGDYTAGDFSDLSPVRFLPNGWFFVYSYQMYLLPDGRNIDGIGCEPSIYVKNTKEDILSGLDPVMDRCLEFLKDEYGIM